VTPRLATAGIFFVNGAVVGTWAAHIPFVRDHLDISKTTIGLCLLAMAAGALVAMPLAGQLLNRRPSAGLARGAAFVEPVLLAGLLFLPSAATLALGLLVFGAVNGLLDVSQNAHGSAIERELGRPVMSSLHAGWSLGGLTGGGFAALGAAAGLDARLEAVLVAAVLVGTVGVVGRRLGTASAATHGAGPVRLAFPARPALLLGALAGIVMLSEGAVADWSALYLHGDLDTSTGVAAVGYAAFAFGMTTGRLTGDGVNRRFGAAPLVRTGCALAAIALGAALLAGAAWATIPALALVGLGVANAVPILFSAGARIPGMAPGPGMAAVTTTGYLGLLAGPPLLGILADATSLPAALGLTVVLVAGAAVGVGPALARTTPVRAARGAERQPEGVTPSERWS
jgi:hypothetical protein